MEIRGVVVSVKQNTDIEKKDGSTYKGALLVFTNDKGEQQQAFHSNALKFNVALKNALSELSPGDNIIITKEKEGEYWNVKDIRKDATPVAKVVSTYTSSDAGRWETKEERAQKQIYIVRQNSITNAIEFLSLGKKSDYFPENVLEVAKQFEAWVFRENTSAAVEEHDDIPI